MNQVTRDVKVYSRLWNPQGSNPSESSLSMQLDSLKLDLACLLKHDYDLSSPKVIHLSQQMDEVILELQKLKQLSKA